jgi:hypothetical protein
MELFTALLLFGIFLWVGIAIVKDFVVKTYWKSMRYSEGEEELREDYQWMKSQLAAGNAHYCHSYDDPSYNGYGSGCDCLMHKELCQHIPRLFRKEIALDNAIQHGLHSVSDEYPCLCYEPHNDRKEAEYWQRKMGKSPLTDEEYEQKKRQREQLARDRYWLDRRMSNPPGPFHHWVGDARPGDPWLGPGESL